MSTAQRDHMRALHLLDMENLVGIPPADASCECYAAGFAEYLKWVEVRASDQVVWASHPANILKATHIANHFLVRARKGKDGADQALLDYVEEVGIDKIQKDFSSVYIGSGDGIFADLARDLRIRGTDVCVVGRARQVSQELSAAAEYQVIYLPEHYHRGSVYAALSDAAVIEEFFRSRMEMLGSDTAD
jgi:hypothetical protein